MVRAEPNPSRNPSINPQHLSDDGQDVLDALRALAYVAEVRMDLASHDQSDADFRAWCAAASVIDHAIRLLLSRCEGVQ
jgi:hypothetical protein